MAIATNYWFCLFVPRRPTKIIRPKHIPKRIYDIRWKIRNQSTANRRCTLRSLCQTQMHVLACRRLRDRGFLVCNFRRTDCANSSYLEYIYIYILYVWEKELLYAICFKSSTFPDCVKMMRLAKFSRTRRVIINSKEFL